MARRPGRVRDGRGNVYALRRVLSDGHIVWCACIFCGVAVWLRGSRYQPSLYTYMLAIYAGMGAVVLAIEQCYVYVQPRRAGWFGLPSN